MPQIYGLLSVSKRVIFVNGDRSGAPPGWGLAISLVGAPLVVAPQPAFWGAMLVAGIFMVHAKEGWFVVGGGRNGVEFNVLLIAALLTCAWGQEGKRHF